jgi:hypothetical protein
LEKVIAIKMEQPARPAPLKPARKHAKTVKAAKKNKSSNPKSKSTGRKKK